MLNAEWHRANPMPKRPSEAQRIAWHRAHAAACSCRPIPAKLAERIRALETAGPTAVARDAASPDGA